MRSLHSDCFSQGACEAAKFGLDKMLELANGKDWSRLTSKGKLGRTVILVPIYPNVGSGMHYCGAALKLPGRPPL